MTEPINALPLSAEDRANLSAILRSEAKLAEQMQAAISAVDLPDPSPTAQDMIQAIRSRESYERINATPNLDSDAAPIQLREAVMDVFSQLPFNSMRDLYWQVGDVADVPAMQMMPPHYQPNQKRGEVIPVYRSEAELRLIRDRSRILTANNEFALCAIENRKNYVVGDGFKYTISPRNPNSAEDREAAKECQYICDAWQEINDLPTLEADAMGRYDEDGEFIYRRYPDAEGFDHIRAVEPEHLTSPGGDVQDPAKSFGVETPADDIETVKAYWIVENPLENPAPDRVPMSRVVHAKNNVKRTAKRGLPTFYPIEANLRRCEDTLASLGHLARARAKIALIRKITGLTSGVAQKLVDKLTAIRATDPTTQADINIEQMRYGTVLTSSGNVEYEFPNANLGASDIIEVLQADLRACASRMQMPEWMFTALADAKYSNAFVVEAPTHKSFRRLQRELRERFGLCRYGHRASLLWRQLKTMVKKGVLKEDALTRIKIQCEGPNLEARDRLQDTERHEKLVALGWESKQSAQKSQELDPAVENPLIAVDMKGKTRPVADMEAVQGLQVAYTSGQISREAGCANLQLIMGFSPEDAAALLPIALAIKRADGGNDAGGDDPSKPGGGGPSGGKPGEAATPQPSSDSGTDGSGSPSGNATPAGDAADALLAKIGAEGAPTSPAKLNERIRPEGIADDVWKLIEHVWAKPTNGFTGEVTASDGVVYHYVNGLRVSGPHFEEHNKANKASTVIANPDAEQFSHLIHMVGEHYVKGDASRKTASKAIDKLLKKYGGSQDHFDALAKEFGYATGGKKSVGGLLGHVLDSFDAGGFSQVKADAAKQMPDSPAKLAAAEPVATGAATPAVEAKPPEAKTTGIKPGETYSDYTGRRLADYTAARATHETELQKIANDGTDAYLAAVQAHMTANGHKAAAKRVIAEEYSGGKKTGVLSLGRATAEQRAALDEAKDETLPHFKSASDAYSAKLATRPQHPFSNGHRHAPYSDTPHSDATAEDRSTPAPGTPERAALEAEAATGGEMVKHDLQIAKLHDMYFGHDKNSDERSLAYYALEKGKVSSGYSSHVASIAQAKIADHHPDKRVDASLVQSYLNDPTQDPKQLVHASTFNERKQDATRALKHLSHEDVHMDPEAEEQSGEVVEKGESLKADLTKRLDAATTPEEVEALRYEIGAHREKADANRKQWGVNRDKREEAARVASAAATKEAVTPLIAKHQSTLAGLKDRVAKLTNLPPHKVEELHDEINGRHEELAQLASGRDDYGDAIEPESAKRDVERVGAKLGAVEKGVASAERTHTLIGLHAANAAKLGWVKGHYLKAKNDKTTREAAELAGPYAITEDGRLNHASSGALLAATGSVTAAKALASVLTDAGITHGLRNHAAMTSAEKSKAASTIAAFKKGEILHKPHDDSAEDQTRF